MPVAWTPVMDQRLLLTAIAVGGLDWGKLSTKWAEIYANDPSVPKPTPRAITEHVAKLRKTLGLSGTGSNNRRPSNGSPKRAAVNIGNGSPGKSKSPAKRRRSNLSDEEESETEDIKLENDNEEEDVAVSPAPVTVPTRAQQPRRAKAEIRKVWVDPATDSSDFEEEACGSTDEDMVDAPPTPETDHDHEESRKSNQGVEVEEDCIKVASPGSPLLDATL